MGTKSPDSEHAQRAARTYGAAADHFDDPALGFWDWYATVARLPPTPSPPRSRPGSATASSRNSGHAA